MSEAIRVLVVSPSAVEADAVATSLETEPTEFAVTTATSGAESIEHLDSGRFDCIVLESDPPDQPGVELLDTLREHDYRQPVVLYTETERPEVVAAAASANVTRLRQSDQHSRLAQTISEVVDVSSPRIDADRVPDRLKQILKTVPACVVELDDNGEFIYANQRATEVLGLQRSEVTERTYNDPEWEIRDLDGDPIPDEQLPFQQVWRTGEPLYDSQHSIRWPDGTEKVLSVSGAPLRDEHGDIESVVFSITDVTERQRRAADLRRYQRIVEHLDDIATIIEPDGTITYVSPAVERILGYDPDELIGENGFGYQPPATRGAVEEAIETVLAHPDEPQTVQTEFRRADGSMTWIESTLRNRLDDDVISGILVSSREINERRTQKQRLRDRERQLSQLHEATRDLLGAETPHEVAELASQAAVEILDLPLNGIHFYDEAVDGLAPAAVSDRSRELFGEIPTIDEGIAWGVYETGEEQIYGDLSRAEDLYNSETPVESELYLPLVDRGVFIISATETEAFTETDIELARVLAANTEAALERISTEQQLRDRETELETQNERLAEFASIVSHDLRNPLNVAQLRVDLLAEESDSEHLPAIDRALDRMADLVSDTLTLARQGDAVTETEEIDLAALVDTCWQTVATGGATVAVVDEATIRGDRSRLQHVFENLFRNAVEHGGPDVTVRVGRIDDGFYVEDTGPGIPDHAKERVFDPGHTSEDGGTGFGLTIVNRIAEAHGWAVAVVDGTDGGARFEFTGVEIVD
ncbi:PAS domain S-box protein [Halovenus sp. WSH3]|uniref:histidine kinase n=1 Tax=Halovenus carboxidivorans TaxID=2692199 RepID=A0A6B0T444_9EURY|nr:PAS domain S-box protein [Halovenus carboxidivorans]MXR50253.1 PAS domain S-box protein [Halovenus carboxidivorans]